MIFSWSAARCFGAFVMMALGIAAPAWANPADILLVNGRIATLDARSAISEALAIEAGRVVATGSAGAMRKLAGANTKIIDLGGRTSIPTFLPVAPASAMPPKYIGTARPRSARRWNACALLPFTPAPVRG
jgi:hypothetical protein